MQSDQISSTVKARSATKMKDIGCFLSSDTKEPSSRSASNYSSRRIRSLNELKKVEFDESDQQFKRTGNKNKIFLFASQVLGKIKNIVQKTDSEVAVDHKFNISELDVSSHHLKLNIRKVNFYYDLLKRLLENRCILLLNEESKFCVNQTLKLIADMKIFYTNEMIKLGTMPIKTYNRFIDSSDISITILQQLFKKVNYICDLHSSLKNNYQEIINFFHVGFDMDLYSKFLKINEFLNNHYSEMFYWTHKILEIFILKLCLADSDSVSPEFLHHIVEICRLFNSLFLNKKEIKYVYFTSVCNALLNSFTQFDYESVLLNFILQYLSDFEAKVAADKIVQFLIAESKNRNNAVMKEMQIENEVTDKPILKSDTSDYCSASPTVIDIENNHISMSENFSFSNMYLSLIQRNQSLVLKYLYSTVCLDTSWSSIYKKDPIEMHQDPSTMMKSWNLSPNMDRNKSYLHLEERYWAHFFQKVFTYTMKIILEIPRHQYGNAAIGISLFWPHSYYSRMLSYLKSCLENRDLSILDLDVMQKVYYSLLIQKVYESWDKKMSVALSIMNGQPCMPIPVASNGVRTRIGNALCSSLQAVRFQFHLWKNIFHLENECQRLFNIFQITLDCFIYVNNTVARASISSADISSYLFLSCSDCVYACKLLEEKEIFGALLKCKHIKLFSYGNQNSVVKQIEILSGHNFEAPYVVYQAISYNVRKNSQHILKRNYSCNVYQNNMLHLPLQDLLNSFTDTINHISDRIAVLSAVTSAVAHELLHILQLIKKKLSKKKIQVLKGNLCDFLNWLEQQKIEPSEKEKLKDMDCLNKLLHIIEILESSTLNQRFCKKRMNKVLPLDRPTDRHAVLTEEETLHWQMCMRYNFKLC